MADIDQVQDSELPIGERLRQAREAKGLSLDEIAGRTRIPVRHLQHIESGDWDALPAITYSVGFVRSYANDLGLDGTALGAELRDQLGGARRPGVMSEQYYEPADPARVPPRWLAIAAAAIAVLLIAGYLICRSGIDDGREKAQPAPSAQTGQAQTKAQPQPVAAPQDPTGQPVVLTASEEVWLRIYEAGGAEIIRRHAAPGERYGCPPAPSRRSFCTGRPNVLRVTVGNSEIPPLGPAERTDPRRQPGACRSRRLRPARWRGRPGPGDTAAPLIGAVAVIAAKAGSCWRQRMAAIIIAEQRPESRGVPSYASHSPAAVLLAGTASPALAQRGNARAAARPNRAGASRRPAPGLPRRRPGRAGDRAGGAGRDRTPDLRQQRRRRSRRAGRRARGAARGAHRAGRANGNRTAADRGRAGRAPRGACGPPHTARRRPGRTGTGPGPAPAETRPAAAPGPAAVPQTASAQPDAAPPAAATAADPAEAAYNAGFRLWEAKRYERGADRRSSRSPNAIRAAAGRAGHRTSPAAPFSTTASQPPPPASSSPITRAIRGANGPPTASISSASPWSRLKSRPDACKVYDELAQVYPNMRDWIRTRLPEARRTARCTS